MGPHGLGVPPQVLASRHHWGLALLHKGKPCPAYQQESWLLPPVCTHLYATWLTVSCSRAPSNGCSLLGLGKFFT